MRSEHPDDLDYIHAVLDMFHEQLFYYTLTPPLLSDDSVDTLRNTIQKQLIELMRSDPSAVERALDHLLIARSLERIGDHATNIAEDVIFLVQGVDVRHRMLVRDEALGLTA